MSIKNTFHLIVGDITLDITKKQYESVLEQAEATACSIERNERTHGAIVETEYVFISKDETFIILAHWEEKTI